MNKAFSLMEMLITLLIISTIFAISAPMLNKKISKQTSASLSPWLRTGMNGSIAFNINNNKNVSVSIGATTPITDKMPALFITAPETFPQIALGLNSKVHGLISIFNKNYWLTNSIPSNVEASIVIGNDSIAGNNATAIGHNAVAKAPNSIVLGSNSTASYNNSIAIGNNISTNKENQIIIGDSEQSIYIKGDLIIEKGISLNTLDVNLSSNSKKENEIANLENRISLLEEVNKELVNVVKNFEIRLIRLENR